MFTPNPSSGHTYRIYEALAHIVIAEEAQKKVSLDEIDFKESLAFLFSTCYSSIKWLVTLGLWFFELEAYLYYLKPFTWLDPPDQRKYFQKWVRSSWYFRYIFSRPLFVFIYSAYYTNIKVAEQIGYKEKKRGQKVHAGPVPGILDVPKNDIDISVEICVIGSGAGGAVVAKELAELGHEVLILEEGGVFAKEYFQKLSTVERNHAMYRHGGMTPTIGRPSIVVPTGKCVGGTTLINSGTCFRTPDSVLNKWVWEYGLNNLTPKNMRPYFDKVEKVIHVETTPEAILGKNNEVIARGIKKMGFHGAPLDRNVINCHGTGECIFGCPTGAKQSMDASYLPLAFKAGAKLYPHCRVERLHKEFDRVTRIDAFFINPQTGKKEAKLTIHPKKVLVCCGTLETPLLLKRSHIGLRSGELGKNLSIHPTAKAIGIFDEVIDGFIGVPQGYMITDFEGEGIFYENVFFPPWLLANSLHQTQEEHLEVMNAYRHVGIYGFLIHDQARGRVFYDFRGNPVIFYNLGNREKELFVKGLKILVKIFFEAGAKKVYSTVRTMDALTSPDQIESLDAKKLRPTDIETAAFHPIGTCRMGQSPHMSVINEDMRVHEMDNCWVVDGSIFPTSLGVNPQVTIMALATKCAEGIHRGLQAERNLRLDVEVLAS